MRKHYYPFFRSNKEYESTIHTYRVAKGLKVCELAKMVGCEQSELSALANGTSAPFLFAANRGRPKGTIKLHVEMLVEILEVPLSVLFPRYICDIERNRETGLLREQMPGITISQGSQNMTEDNRFKERRSKTLKTALKTLSVRERTVIDRRFYWQETLTEVANWFNVSQERVRQIEARALRKLRHPSVAMHIETA